MSGTTIPDAGSGAGGEAAASERRHNPTWVVATVAGAFGLFYAYAVWNAIGNLIQSVQIAGENGLSLNALGWFIWIFAALVPIVSFAVAFAIGYRRPVHHLVLTMLTGLALSAVFWLNVVAYTTLNTASLVS